MRGWIVLAYNKIPPLADDDAILHDNRAIGLVALAHGLVAKSAGVLEKAGLGLFSRLHDRRLGMGRGRSQQRSQGGQDECPG